MEITGSLTEQTTAITDAILGIQVFLLACFLNRYATVRRWRTRLWQGLMILAAGVALAGTVAHGLAMPKSVYELIWKPMLLCLGLVVAGMVLAAVYDLLGEQKAKLWVPWLCAAALGFFILIQLPGTTFLFFILYEIAGMLFTLGGYGFLAVKGRLPGAGMVAAGIVLQILAAGIQAAGPFEVRMIWLFDHNGLFHLIGMLANFVMVFGVARGMRS